MRLSTLLANIYPLPPAADRELLGITQYSTEVQTGYLFIARRGRTFDGRTYIDEVISKGASAVLAEGEQPSLEWRGEVPIISLPQLQQELHELGRRFYADPTANLKLIGVTGTNGKTSTAHFIAQGLTAMGKPCGIIGTLGNGLPGALRETSLTTPDPIQLQRIFADLRSQQAQFVAMEVSSGGLDQQRVKGLPFEVGIFTNLTQDHLDYHGSMEAYGAAKRRLFTEYPLQHAVINADDPFGRELIASLPDLDLTSYGIHQGQGPKHVSVSQVQFELSGMRALVHTPWGEGKLFAPLIGEFNLSNLLAVLTTLCVLGIPLPEALSRIATLKPVPGRMQIFGGGAHPVVVVDYAHTPDALEKALLALRKHCQGKLLCLFGCGGNRDRDKRLHMAEMVERYADRIMVTSDNPRHEDPHAIIADIISGFKNPAPVRVEEDRSKAIADIIQWAGSGDYVLVAGKGAETYQQVGAVKLPFSDAEKICAYLELPI